MTRALLPLLFGLALGGCQPKHTCTADVTAGDGAFSATVEQRGEVAAVQHAAVREACGKLCAAGKGQGSADGCVARCAVDADNGKIGLRVSCK